MSERHQAGPPNFQMRDKDGKVITGVLDAGPYPAGSYMAMVEEREKYLRGSRGPRPSGWNCPECGIRNHRLRTACRRKWCDYEKEAPK